MDDIIILAANWEQDNKELARIRTRVFVDEQKVPAGLESDGLDSECLHVKALMNGVIIGTGRLLPNGFIGRMCVLEQHRNQGIGAKMLNNLVQQAKNSGHKKVSLNSQSNAIPFYKKLGFTLNSEEFIEAGIPHRRMIMML